VSIHLKQLLHKLRTLLLFVPRWFLHGSPLKSDEEIIFFPTSAHHTSEGKWQVPIHAWIYESEEHAFSRELSRHVIRELLELAELTEEQDHSEVFKQRIKWFLVDSERNKRIGLRVGDKTVQSSRSEPNGHITFTIDCQITAKSGTWVKLPLTTPSGETRTFEAEAQLIPEQGLSVISDIDDTIKISEVIDKKALIEHVFFKEYEATPGMPGFYTELAEKGAYFHYISASPWQLYPSLKAFVDAHYPKGSFSLRYFRVTDSSFIRFFRSSMDYKIATISTIIQRYPQHEFILIGDSGENDPEVYATIFMRYPQNVKKILIRKVKGSDTGPERKKQVFADVPDSKWDLYDTPLSTQELLES
jgi:phosphatidate phosphatase APP1